MKYCICPGLQADILSIKKMFPKYLGSTSSLRIKLLISKWGK